MVARLALRTWRLVDPFSYAAFASIIGSHNLSNEEYFSLSSHACCIRG
jgi:hypothetical protein